MLRSRSREFHSLVLSMDVGVGALTFGVLVSMPGMASWGGETSLPGIRLLGLALTASLIWPITFVQLGLYASQRRLDVERIVARLVVAGVIAAVVQPAAAFLLGAPVSGVFPVLCAVVQFAALAALRLSIHAGLRALRATGRNTRNVLIVGSGPRAAYVEEVLGRHPAWGLRIVGFIDDGEPAGGSAVSADEIHKLNDMPELLRGRVIDEVIVACPRSMLGAIVDVVDSCAAAGVPITLLSDLFGDYLPPPQVVRFGSLPALSFAPVHHDRVALAAKRVIDLVGASLLIALTGPVLAAAAAAIKLTSRGPVLFRQIRCGLNGRTFTMLKLRTMKLGAEDERHHLSDRNEMDGGPVFKLRDDPRVTSVGRLLRRFSVDELPQFWNVLRGDMSLVGPRPSLPSEVLEYQTFERRRLSMRPGLTCIWQVSGRNEIGFEDWVRLDCQYIDTWSLGQDVRILLRTLPAVLGGRGAS